MASAKCPQAPHRYLDSLSPALAVAAGLVIVAPGGAVAGNDVTINSPYREDDVFGNSRPGSPTILDTSASPSGNSLTAQDGAELQNAYGGKTNSGPADHNSVVINGGYVAMSVYGGQSINSNAAYGSATYNSVTVNNGAVGGGTFTGGTPSI